MSLITIQEKITGISDRGLNTAAELRDVLEDMVSTLSALSGGQTDYGLTGDLNNINLIFTTSTNFSSGTTQIYLNGLRQSLGSDYIESLNNTITFTEAPENGDLIVADYKTQ